LKPLILHSVRLLKGQWRSLLLLGVILALSAFTYSVVDLGVGTIEESTDAYFESHVQEDFSIITTPTIASSEREALENCPFAFSIEALYDASPSCFESLMDHRVETFDTYGEATLEARIYKDGLINRQDETHDIRVFLDGETINKTYLEAGSMPTGDDEIAILSNYASHNGYTLGDTLKTEGTSYTITGFILLPDYNLPAIQHPLFFMSETQTLAVMDQGAFNDYGGSIDAHIAGVFDSEPFDLSVYSETDSYLHGLLTENNLRSGAVYAEIEGSRGASLALSVLIAFIGIVVVGLMLKKAVDRSKRPFGVLKALGLNFKEITLPFLLLVSLFSLFFLLIGTVLGWGFAPALQQFFLMIYLLPEGVVSINIFTVMVSVLVPFFVLLSLSLIVIRRLLGKEPVVLMRPLSSVEQTIRFKSVRRLLARAPFFTRFQLAFLTRNLLKTTVFTIGVILSVFLAFLAFAMDGVFDETLDAYYEGIDVTHTAHLLGSTDIPDEGERVIEVDGRMHDTQAFVIGLDASQTLHPLEDENGASLLGMLDEGPVISKSFQLLSGLEVGDEAILNLYGETKHVTIQGVADMYPGNHVFMDRASLSEAFLDSPDFYNALYHDAPFDNDYDRVIETENILASSEQINEVIMRVLYVMIVSAIVIGVIIMALLTGVTISDNGYNIALLKVLGYDNKEIGRMILGGYNKMLVLGFIIAVPISLVSFSVMTQLFADVYSLVWPMSISVWQIFMIFVLYGMIYMIVAKRARREIERVSLQKALKIYQD